MSRQTMVDYYKKYYHPKNAFLIVSGNFNKTQARNLVHHYFEKKIATKKIAYPKADIKQGKFKVN